MLGDHGEGFSVHGEVIVGLLAFFAGVFVHVYGHRLRGEGPAQNLHFHETCLLYRFKTPGTF